LYLKGIGITNMIKQRHQNVPASYLVLFDNNKVLLLKRSNTGYEDGKYSLVAGHVDPEESFTQCIIREAKEEAGIELQKEDIKMVHVMHRNSGSDEYNERIDVFFRTEKWIGEIINKEPNKCDDLSWFDLDYLPTNTIPYIKQALDMIKNKICYSEFGWN
jgi:8-oxo-dGTP pyrophosphatase MutT (NUDIX family)